MDRGRTRRLDEPLWGLVRSAAAATLLLAASLPLAAQESSPAPAGVNPEGRRLMVFALDGITWEILTPLLQRGDLRTLSRLIRDGASGELQTLPRAHSPVVWTSVATGKSKEKHGILDFWYEGAAGELSPIAEERGYLDRLEALGYLGNGPRLDSSRKILYHSGKRTAQTVWQILGDRGLSSDVVGWWVSYPVEPILGRMISDRYVFNRFELVAAEKGHVYQAGGGHLHPDELRQLTEPLVVAPGQVSGEEMQRFIRGAFEVPDRLTLHDAEDELRIVYAKDLSFRRMAGAMLEQAVPDLFVVYFQGTDISGHYFWKHRFPDDWARRYPDQPVPPAEVERYRNVMDAYYEMVDEWIGELVAFGDERTTIVVLSDHGMKPGKRGPQAGLAARTVSGVHTPDSPPGVLIVSGYGISAGARLEGAHVYDVAPTLLALMGVPAESDMDGRVLHEVFAAPVTHAEASAVLPQQE